METKYSFKIRLRGGIDADSSWAFVLPTTLLRLPYSLVQAAIWTSVVRVGTYDDAKMN
jgi:hypothetical protein